MTEFILTNTVYLFVACVKWAVCVLEWHQPSAGTAGRRGRSEHSGQQRVDAPREYSFKKMCVKQSLKS